MECQAIFRSKHQLKPGVDISDAVAASGGWNLPALNTPEGFFVHTASIVFYIQKNGAGFLAAADADGAPLVLFLSDAVQNGVFHQGLQNNFGDGAVL